MGRSKWVAVCLSICLLLAGTAFAGDPLGRERSMMKAILKQVSSEMADKFYDPNMKGLDWKGLTAEANTKIEGAKSLGEMMTAIHTLVMKLDDSHTAFIPPGRNVTYRFGYDAKPFGDEIRVYALKKNGRAEKAGVKIGDRILAINKFKPTRRNFDDMMYFFKVIRNLGVFDLTIQRGEDPPFDIHVEAEKKVEAVYKEQEAWDMIWDLIREYDKQAQWHHRSFKDGIGYAQIRFFKFEGEDFMSGIVDASLPTKAIILDFRSNGGGEENALKNFAGMFESKEQVMAEVVGRKKTEQMIVRPKRPHYQQPLLILVDADTGSAAEMFARHFQRTGRAVIVGDKTSGKVTRAMGYYQELGAAAVVPYATYIGVGKVILPGGEELEKNGVTPDVQCIPTQKDVAEENDTCLIKAVQLARKAIGLNEDPTLTRVPAIVDRD